MKTTIRINGLDVEFTDQKPTRPGVYWHLLDNHPEPYVITVTEKYGVYAIDQLHVYKGLWSAPLVPAVEVDAERIRIDGIIREAHRALGEAINSAEDIASGRRDDTDLLEVFIVLGREIESRARRVVEGE